ncbi:hypothetical protein LTR56_000272 [Elasticomyces elasticus]|nr:hypothetical protein LTR56_000272 [Elasticomyces elasticus]KAK3667033.1 hypothetical protein LTR22_002258 [Elasticomyces elasticus]KAK4911708.1 hypothetical protein LTR49_019787 [Elasticomyces elasticus]KAK5751294.1 hypothetical protein LTS12_018610 [Elasticomyces elasticus]
MAHTHASRTIWDAVWSLAGRRLQSHARHTARAVCSRPSLGVEARRHLRVTASPPDFARIDANSLIEEETFPNYQAHWYYPVTIGQTFNNRYRVVAKLGYGSASTVWLCRDTHSRSDKTVYVALKIYINCSKWHRSELLVYEHINNLDTEHGGQNDVRKMLAHFILQGPYGSHVCLVHEACGFSLGEFKRQVVGGRLPVGVVREGLRNVLCGMQFLHEEAKVVHTDLHAENILVGIHSEDDASVFIDMERHESEHPSPRKRVAGRVIYKSHDMPLTHGLPVVSDLSEARGVREGVVFDDLVMPVECRAPEVILDMPWSYPIDVWSFGMTAWELLEPQSLVEVKNDQGEYSEEQHLAHLVAILGPPPLEFLKRSDRTLQY